MQTQTKTAKPTFSADPNKAIQEMMDTIDQMRRVYERETDALEKLDTKGFLSLQEEKLNATNAYKFGIEDVLSRKETMKTVDPALKKDLKRMQDDFADLSMKNLNALKLMQRTMARVGGKVQKAAKDSVNKQRTFSYGEGGKLEQNERKSISTGVSETA